MSTHRPSNGSPSLSDREQPPPEVSEDMTMVATMGEHPTATINLAADIASESGGELFVLMPVRIPHPTPLTLPDISDERTELESLVESLAAEQGEAVEIKGLVRIGRTEVKIVRHVLESHGIETIVIEDDSRDSLFDYSRLTDFSSADCDLVAVTRVDEIENIASILVPVAGGPHSGLAVDVARAIASRNRAWIDLLHVLDDNPTEAARTQGEKFLDAGLERLDDFVDADTWLTEAADISDGIIDQTQYYDLTVIGAPRRGRLKKFVFGSTTKDIRTEATGPVLTVQSNSEQQSWLDRLLSA